MSEDFGFVEDAATQYTDWRGTVAADNPDFGSLEERLGLDFENYMIVGFGVHHEHGSGVTVYAIPRRGLEGLHVWHHVDSEGNLPVIEFTDTSGLRFDELLGLFKRLEVVAVLRGAIADQGVRLKVVERRDAPPLLEEPDDEGP